MPWDRNNASSEDLGWTLNSWNSKSRHFERVLQEDTVAEGEVLDCVDVVMETVSLMWVTFPRFLGFIHSNLEPGSRTLRLGCANNWGHSRTWQFYCIMKLLCNVGLGHTGTFLSINAAWQAVLWFVVVNKIGSRFGYSSENIVLFDCGDIVACWIFTLSAISSAISHENYHQKTWYQGSC